MLRRFVSRRPGWSIPIARVFGIPLRLHVTFLVLPALVSWAAVTHGQDVGNALGYLALVVACILLHELAHAGVARRSGIRVSRVTMYPTGGIAWFDEVPEPNDEWKIAVAGPLVNIGIAFVLGTILFVAMGTGGLVPAAVLEPSAYGLMAALLWTNLSLAAFNLVPAYPMDGGRILRAVLALRLDSRRATVVALVIGMVLASGVGIAGVVTQNAWLGVLAVVVLVGAFQQSRAEQPSESSLTRWATEATVRRFVTLQPDNLLAEAASLASVHTQQEFPVVDPDGHLRGVLIRPSLYHGLHFRGPTARVGDEMDSDVTVVRPRGDLREVLTLEQARTGRPILVVDEGRVVGMIPAVRVREYVEIEAGRISAA